MSSERPIVVVTGATDGIGKQTALEIARRGAHVIVHGRSASKAEATASEIRNAVDTTVDIAVGDFASLDSVRALAADLTQRFPRIDVLVNNAGVYMEQRVVTADGFETTFEVNHLAPFLLTLSVMKPLRAAPRARIVNVASQVHQSGRMVWDDLDAAKRYDGYAAYSNSKLANVLFTYALARRLAGTHVTTNVLHPGVITTKLLWQGFRSRGASLERGAATSVKLAMDPALAHVTGKYFDDEREVRSSASSHDEEAQERLWQISLERTHAPDIG